MYEHPHKNFYMHPSLLFQNIGVDKKRFVHLLRNHKGEGKKAPRSGQCGWMTSLFFVRWPVRHKIFHTLEWQFSWDKIASVEDPQNCTKTFSWLQTFGPACLMETAEKKVQVDTQTVVERMV